MKFVFVTGSRRDDYSRGALFALMENHPDAVYVHGDCPSGLDGEVSAVCASSGPGSEIPMPARWEMHGKSAGPIRNGHMVRLALALQGCGHIVEWHAFPGPSSRGTWDCVNQARMAGFDVEVHRVKQNR